MARKPAEGLLTFLAVAAGFTLLSLMISMNLTAREILDHSRMDRLSVYALFNDPSGPGGLPLAIGDQIAHMDGVVGVAASRWLGGYHVDPHNYVGIRTVNRGMRTVWSDGPIRPGQWDQLFATPAGIFASIKAASKWGIKTGDVFTVITQPNSRADGGTTWEFQVLGVVPDDENWSGTNGFMVGNSQYVENTAPLDQRGLGYSFYVALRNAGRAVAISDQINQRYVNSATATQAFSERLNAQTQVNVGFNTETLTLSIGGAGFAMVLFLTGNAIARSVRERVPEFAVLKTLGFHAAHLLSLVFVESVIPCVLGAVLGTETAILVSRWLSHLLPQSLTRMLTPSLATVPVLAQAIALAVLLALASCAMPMLRLRRLSVADALAGR
ncbi:MAG TPA: FtsX-like permease family protein [Steroidobacteraceae bacterium]|nr:FtsX-like permease family protein [Steroidobacteraceae bacterium]